jgi:hypothetical protein
MVGQLLKNLKTEPLYYPAILLLGMYPKERKVGPPAGIWVLLSIAALFMTATEEKRRSQMWYIHALE